MVVKRVFGALLAIQLDPWCCARLGECVEGKGGGGILNPACLAVSNYHSHPIVIVIVSEGQNQTGQTVTVTILPIMVTLNILES